MGPWTVPSLCSQMLEDCGLEQCLHNLMHHKQMLTDTEKHQLIPKNNNPCQRRLTDTNSQKRDKNRPQSTQTATNTNRYKQTNNSRYNQTPTDENRHQQTLRGSPAASTRKYKPVDNTVQRVWAAVMRVGHNQELFLSDGKELPIHSTEHKILMISVLLLQIWMYCAFFWLHHLH